MSGESECWIPSVFDDCLRAHECMHECVGWKIMDRINFCFLWFSFFFFNFIQVRPSDVLKREFEVVESCDVGSFCFVWNKQQWARLIKQETAIFHVTNWQKIISISIIFRLNNSRIFCVCSIYRNLCESWCLCSYVCAARSPPRSSAVSTFAHTCCDKDHIRQREAWKLYVSCLMKCRKNFSQLH